MTAYTPRQMRVIAAEVERLTKARRVNEQNRLPTTPDVHPVKFPDGTVGILRWAKQNLPTYMVERRLRRGDTGDCYHYLLDLGVSLANGIDPATQAAIDHAQEGQPHALP